MSRIKKQTIDLEFEKLIKTFCEGADLQYSTKISKFLENPTPEALREISRGRTRSIEEHAMQLMFNTRDMFSPWGNMTRMYKYTGNQNMAKLFCLLSMYEREVDWTLGLYRCLFRHYIGG